MPPFPFQLAAIDIDDTLVGPDKRVGPANRSAVARLVAAGCRVVLASGRRHESMLDYGRELGLRDFVISAQGALVKHAVTGEVLLECPVPAGVGAAIVADGLARGLTVIRYDVDGVYVQPNDTEWALRYIEVSPAQAHVRLKIDLRDRAGVAPLKVIWAGAPAQLDALVPALTTAYAGRAGLVVTMPYLLEFNAPGADKATGVAAVAAHYGIRAGRALAFGDGNNDVPMLRWAGLGVAMDHGRESARRAARLVAPAGDPESSLARAVELVFANSA